MKLPHLKFIDSEVKMPMMRLPVRTVLVSVGGNWIMISPGSKVTREAYDPKLNVTDIVAPNLFHHSGILKAKSIYPTAKLWGSPGLQQKRSDINWDLKLSPLDWPYSKELSLFQIEGMPAVNEVLFLHRPSRSLIVTDLCFNLQNAKGLGARMILGLFGSFRKFAVSKFFIKMVKDKKQFEQSLALVMAEDFDNIIVSHGDNVLGNAKAKLREALKERGFKL